MRLVLRHVVVWLVAVGAAAGLLAGCGAPEVTEGTAGKEITPVNAGAIPPTLAGMKVTLEDSTDYLKEIDRTYLEQFSLFSVREAELLQATLQVSRFTDDAKYTSAAFRNSVVDRVGSAKAQQFRMGDREIYMTVGTKQQIAVWFDGAYMFVLSIRDDFLKPRALVREALGIKL